MSVARNVALARAAGKYVLMLDSDDLLIEGSLSLILEKAINSEVDIVMADFLKMEEEELSMPFHIPVLEDVEWKEKTGKQFFVEELNPRECYVWRSVYRREFLQSHQIQFVPGIYYQDISCRQMFENQHLNGYPQNMERFCAISFHFATRP